MKIKIKMTTHGDDARKYKNVMDFASNLNPYGVSKKTLQAVTNNLNKISQYPDSDCTELRKELARYNNINPENIIAGNGSAEIIRLFCEVFLNRGDGVLITVPSFSEYGANAKLFGGKIEYVGLNPYDNFKIGVDEILNKVNNNTRIIFLCSPNNPTGKLISKEDVQKIVKENPQTHIFLDEAFIEFSKQNSLAEEVEKYKNLFILRSMTKFFGLAGLRVGYGIGNKNLIKRLSDLKLVWNVNSLAQIAAIESLKDEEYIRDSKDLMGGEKQNLFKKLSVIPGIRIYPSDANFFLINIKDTGLRSHEMKMKLLERGILIRDCSNFRGLNENYVRICVRTREDNEKLINAIKEII
ncbi:MAG: histidinol-phosphate transaminase [Candidatus Altiarchaeales archaeon WOR_SM1_86-2]|nr:MAG: histidinol-phosphate transaminase [Candidatus Altiarchaeales archaeon WOR_SM1_86-2]